MNRSLFSQLLRRNIMCRKVFFLTSLVAVLAFWSVAKADFKLKVDLAVNDDGPWKPTDKSQQEGFGDWVAWAGYGNDKENHDARAIDDVGGSGINIGLGIGNGSSSPGSVLDFTTAADDPICNTWLRSGDKDGYGDPGENCCHIVLYGDGLTPGTYLVYGYHNIPGSDEPNMPRVYVQTYSGFFDPNILMQNVGAPNDPDGGGVIVEANDVNVPVMHVGDDDLLDANVVSLVKFFTDGSPVKITYENADEHTAVLNAFIILVSTPKIAYLPFPKAREPYACPDTDLIWSEGKYADKHNVYFGTDLRDELLMFEDDFESGDANWVPSNWTIYDSNVLGDGNSDGNSHSSYHSYTPGSGSGTLTTVDINASGASCTTLRT